MAIVNMTKFLLFSFEDDREKLLSALQKFNYVHFNNLEYLNLEEDLELDSVSEASKINFIDEQLVFSKWAIELLGKFAPKESAIEALKKGQDNYTLTQLQNMAKNFDFQDNYDFLKELDEQIHKYKEDIKNIQSDINDLVPWKSITIPISEIKSSDSVSIYTGSVPLKYAEQLPKLLGDFEFTDVQEVSKDKNNKYLLIITNDIDKENLDEILRMNAFSHINIKTDGIVEKRISELKKEKQQKSDLIDDLNEKIKSKFDLLNDFKAYHEYYANERRKLALSENFLKTSKVDVIEGYVPTDRLGGFTKLISEILGECYSLETCEASKDDPRVPIILKNGKFATAFESLTEMYSMPKYNEIDPTPLFAPFYCFFAGIMVGDFGYGILTLVACLFALKAFNLSDSKRKFIEFFKYLSISTCFWGLIFGSVFGGIIDLPKLLDPSVDYQEIIIMSLIFGGIHLFFGLGIKAYMNIRDKKYFDALFDVGFWYMAVLGPIVMFLSKKMDLNPTLYNVSKIIMIIGMIGIVATGGRDEKTIVGKIGWGLYSLYGITSYIGDFVSYLRLMALNLSGAFIAVAVNSICSTMLHSAVGFIFAAIIFVVFQLFNAFLSYLSAYVHSARLTYVEMFNKFYEGGGIPFKKMISNSKYFNIKED